MASVELRGLTKKYGAPKGNVVMLRGLLGVELDLLLLGREMDIPQLLLLIRGKAEFVEHAGGKEHPHAAVFGAAVAHRPMAHAARSRLGRRR